MAKASKSEKRPYSVVLPSGVRIKGYFDLRLAGQIVSSSARGAVSRYIGKQNPDIVGLVMSELDANFGGAGSHAFVYKGARPKVAQSRDDLERGRRLNSDEREILEEHAFAYELATSRGEDTSQPDVQFRYLDLARFSLRPPRKTR